MVWNEDLLNVQLNHGSLWREFELVSSGRIHLSANPNPLADLDQFEERLRLHDGVMEMSGRTSTGPVEATCLVAEGADVFVIHVSDGRSGRRGLDAVLKSAASVLVFPTEEGATHVIERADAPLASFRSERLVPAPNAGPKYPGCKRIVPHYYCDTDQRAFIGIAAEGLNPVRHTIRKTRERAEGILARHIGCRPNLAAAAAGATAYVVDEAGRPRPEPRLNDGIVGEPNAAPVGPPGIVRIDLGWEAMLSGLVWSVDRECRWTPLNASRWKDEIQVSIDGRTWTKVDYQSVTKRTSWGAYDVFPAMAARYVQLTVGADASLDEVEVYGVEP